MLNDWITWKDQAGEPGIGSLAENQLHFALRDENLAEKSDEFYFDGGGDMTNVIRSVMSF